MTLSHKNCIFLNFLSESLKTDTEDLPDQIETGVQFSQIKAKQTNKRPQLFQGKQKVVQERKGH